MVTVVIVMVIGSAQNERLAKTSMLVGKSPLLFSFDEFGRG